MGRERERPIPFGEQREEGTTEKKDCPSVRPSIGPKSGAGRAEGGATEADETAKQRKWRGREHGRKTRGQRSP